MRLRFVPAPESLARLKKFCDGLEKLLDLGPAEVDKINTAVRIGFAWNFTHESAGGEPWPELAPMTVRQRQALGFAGEHPILQRTRQLKLSLVDPQHPHCISIVRRESGRVMLELGSSDPRFPILHAGGVTAEGRTIPARPMVVLGSESIEQLRRTVEYVMRERFKRL